MTDFDTVAQSPDRVTIHTPATELITILCGTITAQTDRGAADRRRIAELTTKTETLQAKLAEADARADMLAADLAEAQTGRPVIVCLCGSTRFRDQFDATNRELTLAGRIVLAPGVFAHADGIPISDRDKAKLDTLHLAKILAADEVFVVNVGGYVGASTAAEIAYATAHGKTVKYLEHDDGFGGRQ